MESPKAVQSTSLNKALKIAARLLFALAVGATLLYLSLPSLTAWLAEHLLGSRGVSDPHVEVSYIGLDRLRIGRVRFTWDQAPVSLGPIDVSYGLSGVLEGRVNTIRIEKGSIAVPRGEDTGGGRLPETLPPLPVLPFRTLNIKALRIELPEKPTLNLAGEWTATGDGLSGRTTIGGAGAERAVLIAGWQEGDLALRLSAPGDLSAPWAQLHLSRADAGLEADAVLEGSAQSLRTALKPWWEMPGDWRGRGRILLDGRVGDNGFEGEYRTAIALQGPTAWRAELKGKARITRKTVAVTVAEDGRIESEGPGSQRFSVTFPQSFRAEGRMPFGADGQQGSPAITGQGAVVVTLEGVAERLSANASLSQTSLTFGKNLEIRSSVQATGTVRREDKPPIKLAAAGPLRWSSGELRWTLQPGANIAIPEPYTESSDSPLRLDLRGEATIAWRRHEGWKAAPSSWRVDAPDWTSGATRVAIKRWLLELRQLQGKGAQWEGSGIFTADSLRGVIGTGELAPLAVEGRFTAGPEQVVVSAAVQGSGLSVEFSAMHHLKEQNGAANWQLAPVNLRPGVHTLASFYEPWPFPFDVGRGEIGAGGRFQWQTGGEEAVLSGEIDVEGTGLGGYFRDVLFSGAVTKAWLAFDPDGVLRTRQPAPLTIEQLTAGIPSRDFQGRVGLRVSPHSPPVLKLERPSVELLGGRVRSDAIALDFGQRVNRFEVELDRIGLDQLLELEKAPVDGFGRVSGTLPVRLTEEGLAMDDGQVAAIESGVIRYRPGEEGQALGQNSRNMQLAIAALRDFHYESLKASADYAPSGQLDLQIRLLGNNPDLFQGRSVQFNINIEENLPDLLRSLRAGQALEGQIDEWVQDFYRRRRNAMR